MAKLARPAATEIDWLEQAPVPPLPYMARYFFHTFHDRAEIDHVGEELPDKHAAWREATRTAGQILQGINGRLEPDREWRMGSDGTSFRTLFTSCTSMSRNRSKTT